MRMFRKKSEPEEVPFHEATGVDLVAEVVTPDGLGYPAVKVLRGMGIKELSLGEGSPRLDFEVEVAKVLGTVKISANGRTLVTSDLDTFPEAGLPGLHHYRAEGYIWRSQRTALYGVRLYL